MFNLIDELRLHELNPISINPFIAYEQPDKLKWKNGDCPKCHNVFCVIDRREEPNLCIECGYNGPWVKIK